MAERRPRFVSIEGLRGAGKSTVVEGVAHRLGAETVATVSDRYSSIRSSFDGLEAINARYLMFASAVADASVEIEKRIQAGRSVVVESYMGRTTAFHRGMGATVDVVWGDEIVRPDLTIFLAVSEEVRRARLARRSKAPTIWDECAEASSAAILREYEAWPAVAIDTTALSEAEVIEAIISIASVKA
jgi:thymidylate kinase